MEAAPHFRVIEGGEVEPVCDSCITKDLTIERLTRSYEGTIASLHRQLEEKRDRDKQLEPLVEEVVADWCRKAHASGVWKQMPRITEPRIDATQAAFNKGHDPGYLMGVNTGAFAAVATDRNVKPQWLEPAAIYGKFIDAHYQTSLDPSNAKLKKLLTAPQVLLDRWQVVEALANPCDHCGHPALLHDQAPIGLREGRCMDPECECVGFDDQEFREERFKQQQDRKARRRT